MTYSLILGLAAIVVVPSPMRGMFFREDYLRYVSAVGVFAILFAAVALFRERPIWSLDFDIALAGVTLLYALSIFWSKSRASATDGALKYGAYFLIYLMARYLATEDHGEVAIRASVIASAVVASGIGLLTAGGHMKYLDAVIGGRLSGSLQYPNSLAAFAMFASFLSLYFLYQASSPAASASMSALLSLLLLVVTLSLSRATLMIHLVMLAYYFVLAPGRHRARLAVQFALAATPALAVTGRLSAAIQSGNGPLVNKFLSMSILMAAALGCSGALVRRHLEGRTLSQPGKAEIKMRSPRTAWLALAVTVLLVVSMVLLLLPFESGIASRIVPSFLRQRFALGFKDPSLLGRLFATQDAVAIAVDNPLGTGAGGWNLLYHQYQKTLYFFTEVHNHFAQVLVEIGVLGLALYAAFWAGVVYSIFLAWRRSRLRPGDEGETEFLRVLSTGTAVLALGVHSAVDFDLSIPAIAAAMFALSGSLLAEVSRSRDPGRPSMRGAAFRGFGPLLVQAAVIIAVAAMMISPARRYFRGMALGSRGVQLLVVGSAQQGRDFLIAASQADPHTASYILDVARTFAREYVASSNGGSKSMAKMYLNLALEREPNDSDVLAQVCSMLHELESYDEAAELVSHYVTKMPMDPQSYQFQAELVRVALLKHAEMAFETADADTRSREIGLVKEYASTAEAIPQAMQAAASRVVGIYAQVFSPAELKVTPPIDLLLGEVSFLRGDSRAASEHLTAASKNSTYAKEANVWLSSLAIVRGAPGTMVDPQSLRIAQAFGLIR